MRHGSRARSGRARGTTTPPGTDLLGEGAAPLARGGRPVGKIKTFLRVVGPTLAVGGALAFGAAFLGVGAVPLAILGSAMGLPLSIKSFMNVRRENMVASMVMQQQGMMPNQGPAGPVGPAAVLPEPAGE